MPELPEVETIRLGLEKYVVGKTIVDVEVRLPRIFSGNQEDIIGGKVLGVRRFGKGLVMDFDNGYSLAVHVKMTGQLLYQGKDAPKGSKVDSLKVGPPLPNKFTHVIFTLNSSRHSGKSSASRIKDGSWTSQDDMLLYYNDIRQFGWLKIVKTDEVKNLPFFKDLGPEPPVLDVIPNSIRDPNKNTEMLNQVQHDRNVLTLEMFKSILAKKKTAIKPLLMDQKLMSGIGNIYANDALFRARVHPKRSANSLSTKEMKALLDSIEVVLTKGLEVGGASEWQYVNVLGQTGNYQNFFLIYNKTKCTNCGGNITKIQLGGRGTYFCENCQK